VALPFLSIARRVCADGRRAFVLPGRGTCQILIKGSVLTFVRFHRRHPWFTSNIKIGFVGRRFLDAAEGDFEPNAFVAVIKEDLGEKFNARNRQGQLYPAGDQKRNNHGVNAAG